VWNIIVTAKLNNVYEISSGSVAYALYRSPRIPTRTGHIDVGAARCPRHDDVTALEQSDRQGPARGNALRPRSIAPQLTPILRHLR